MLYQALPQTPSADTWATPQPWVIHRISPRVLGMTASIGVWACGEPTGAVVLYRWEADGQTGFVTFEVAAKRFRPADEHGEPIGDLLYATEVPDLSGSAPGVDQRLFVQAVVAILRACRRAGHPTATAHAYYY